MALETSNPQENHLSSVKKTLYHSMKYWLVQKGIPRSWTNCYNLQYMKGGIIPQLIINRQGWIAATAHLEKSRAMSLCHETTTSITSPGRGSRGS